MRNIIVSGNQAERIYKQTEGEADVIEASDNVVIEHHGNAKSAIAQHGGHIVVSGIVTERAIAIDKGWVNCHGDTEKVNSTLSGNVTLAGNPEEVEATHNSNIVIFGEPKKITSMHSSWVTVITLNEEYQPDSLTESQYGSLRLIRPYEGGKKDGGGHLAYHLEKLYPEGAENPLFVAYSGLLQHGYQIKDINIVADHNNFLSYPGIQ